MDTGIVVHKFSVSPYFLTKGDDENCEYIQKVFCLSVHVLKNILIKYIFINDRYIYLRCICKEQSSQVDGFRVKHTEVLT